MEHLSHFVDFFLHLDKHLTEMVQQYGSWAYLVLFVIIFCETGLVVTPILPGDSLLFAIGALTSAGSFDLVTVLLTLTAAAILGDAVNYHIGRIIGPRVFEKSGSKIFRPQYLQKTQEFYERYGGKTIIIARFVPIVRTFAPFLAGVGKMGYPKFALYNITGAVLWIFAVTLAGYFFGEIPVVKNNFTLVIFGIIIVSLLPGVFEIVRARRAQGSR